MLTSSPLRAVPQPSVIVKSFAAIAFPLLVFIVTGCPATAKSTTHSTLAHQVAVQECHVPRDECDHSAECVAPDRLVRCPSSAGHGSVATKGDGPMIGPVPHPPTPKPVSTERVLNQTISVTFNTFVSFPDLAKPLKQWQDGGHQRTGTASALAANTAYGIGVGVATNGVQTAVSIGAGVTGAAVWSGRSGSSTGAVGQGIGIAMAIDTPSSALVSTGGTVVSQFISISVNTNLAIFGVGSAYGVGTLAALPGGGVRTSDRVTIVSTVSLPAAGKTASVGNAAALVTAATLSGSTTLAAQTSPSGSATAVAQSVNASKAAALVVSSVDPASAPIGPTIIHQTLIITSNTVIGAPPKNALVASATLSQTPDQHASVSGLGIGSGGGHANVDAAANGAGNGSAQATGPLASAAGADGQGVSAAATNLVDKTAPTDPGTHLQAVTIAINDKVSVGKGLGPQKASGPVQANTQLVGSTGVASANAFGNAAMTTPTMSANGAGLAGSVAASLSPSTAGAGGAAVAAGQATLQSGLIGSPVTSSTTGLNAAQTMAQINTTGPAKAASNAGAAGQAVAATQTGPTLAGSGQSGLKALAGTTGGVSSQAGVTVH